MRGEAVGGEAGREEAGRAEAGREEEGRGGEKVRQRAQTKDMDGMRKGGGRL